jgi:lysozyme
MELVAISVSRLLSVPVTQGQFDALCSFAFNVGAWENGLSTSTLLRKLNQGDVQGAGGEFSRWVYATVGGEKKRLQGLVRRREAEAKLFRTGQYP